MSEVGNFLNQAIELIKQATTADGAEDYAEAYKLYQRGLQYFMAALKYEKSENIKSTIRRKVDEYMSRAEQLKEHLDAAAKGGSGKKKSAIGAGGTAQKKDGDEDSEDEEDPEKAKMRGALEGAIISEKPNVKWSDVAGLEMAKDALKEAVIMPLKFPHLFTGKRKPWRGILLYGPPGTGKSFLAKAVATETDSTFFSVSSADLVSKWLGESEKLVRSLFEMARENKPAIIFIDEIDSLASTRSDSESESSRRIKTEFLVQMNGVGNDTDGVLVLAATNIPWGLDSAVRRRFERRIYIPLPQKPARRRMIDIHLGDTPHSLSEPDKDVIAENTEGYSGSDMSVVVRDAIMEPIRGLQNATHFKHASGPDPTDPDKISNNLLTPCSPGDPAAKEMDLMSIDPNRLLAPTVTLRDFLKALSNTKPTVGPADLKQQEEFTKEFGSSDQ